MEVDLKAAVSQRLESYASEIKQMLGKNVSASALLMSGQMVKSRFGS